MPESDGQFQKMIRARNRNNPDTKSLNKTPKALAKNLALVWGVWVYLLALVAILGGLTIMDLFRGNLIGATIEFAGMIYLAWALAGAFIAIPLSVYAMDYGKVHPSQIEQPYKKALKLWNRLHLRKDIAYAGIVNTIAFLRQDQGDLEGAEQKYEEAIQVLERSRRGAYPHLAAALNNLSTILLKQQKLTEAEQRINASLAIWEKQKPPEWCGSAIPLTNKGDLRLRQNRFDEAEDLLLQAKRRFESTAQPGMIIPQAMKQARIACFICLSLVYAKQGRKGDLRNAVEQMLAGYKTCEITPSPLGLDVLMELAEHCLELGETELATRIVQQGYEIGRQRPDHPYSLKVLETYERILSSEGRKQEIEDMKRWLLPG